MKLSCIILTYNEEEFIKQCIDSIKNQDFDDYEIIVVDDGSTDDTLQILESIEGIKLIKSNHVGHAAARNIGMRKASADIVFFVEADAIYSQNFLRDCYTRFANKDVGGGIGKLEVWNKDTPWTRCRNAELNARFSDYKPFTGWMYSKKLVEQVGGFDEKLSIGE
ncbi:MAG: glycosyltransferase family 2 protein, partial [Methanocellales archaeon]|nr:glycosyltransferase family 2 protein [Methanocellales archaeon]